MRVFRNGQPAHCQQSSLQSSCMLHKNTSGDRIKADPAPFYPHLSVCLCNNNQKKLQTPPVTWSTAAPSTSQTICRRRRGHTHFLWCLFTPCICITTGRTWNKSLLTHTYSFPCPTKRTASDPTLPVEKSVCGQGGGNSHEQKPWSDSVSRWLLFALVSTALAWANTTPSGNLNL